MRPERKEEQFADSKIKSHAKELEAASAPDVMISHVFAPDGSEPSITPSLTFRDGAGCTLKSKAV